MMTMAMAMRMTVALLLLLLLLLRDLAWVKVLLFREAVAHSLR